METSTQELNILESLDLDRFFELSQKNYDLVDGTAINGAGTRLVYLPEDAIAGIYAALYEEAGPAWRLILKNCGIIWGRRVAENLNRELGLLYSTEQGALVVPEFVRLIERYFSSHGWGKLSINLEHAATKGVVLATLEHSIFVSVIDGKGEMVDPMIEGLLKSLFQEQAGQELDALEIACADKGAPYCEFVISGMERLEPFVEKMEDGCSGDEVKRELLA